MGIKPTSLAHVQAPRKLNVQKRTETGRQEVGQSQATKRRSCFKVKLLRSLSGPSFMT